MRAIVGFDPGVTSGLAVISLGGEVLFLDSFRGKSINQISEEITKVAQPLIVATDVSPTPDSVVKLSRSFGAVLFEPTISLTVEEKQSMTSGISIKDIHQRDALAAALAAHRAYLPLIQKTKLKTGSKYEQVFEKILKGRSSKISEAAIEPAKLLPKKSSQDLLRQFRNLQINRDHLAREIERLREENADLSNELKKAKSEVEKFRSETYREFAQNKKIQELQTRISNLDKNQRQLFGRVKGSESRLEEIGRWLENRLDTPLICRKEGEGLKVGGVVLIEEPRSTIKKIIEEHRKRKS